MPRWPGRSKGRARVCGPPHPGRQARWSARRQPGPRNDTWLVGCPPRWSVGASACFALFAERRARNGREPHRVLNDCA
eukprot:3645381-Alexandrium_andersonii.AAC.1